MTYTRYGKSFVVALAILLRICTFPEKWSIVAGRAEQAKIIMNYIIQHSFDNEFFKNKLELTEGESLERLRRERSKTRLNYKHSNGRLGEVFVLSADSRNKQTAGDAVMGFGAPNVVLDEAALIDDDIEAKIFRMLGDQPDNFYLKIGNPFRNNHFRKDYDDENFYKFNADYIRGLEEGRLDYRFVEEARSKPLFGVLYANKFPPKDAIDQDNYLPLLTEEDLVFIDDSAFTSKIHLGVDPSGGGDNLTAWVARDNFIAKVAATEATSNEKTIAEKTINIMFALDIPEGRVSVDEFGCGAKTSLELLQSSRISVNSVNTGNPGDEKERFLNIRAELAFKLRDWVKAGGRFVHNDELKKQILSIRYKVNERRIIKLMSKDDMRKNGIASPDLFDALCLSFASDSIVNDSEDRKRAAELATVSLHSPRTINA